MCNVYHAICVAMLSQTAFNLGSGPGSSEGDDSRMLECGGRLAQVELAQSPLGALDHAPYRFPQTNQRSSMSNRSKNQPTEGQNGRGKVGKCEAATHGGQRQSSEPYAQPPGATSFASETCGGEQSAGEPEPARGVPIFVMLPLDTVRIL
jgi:hypothetical protein